MCPGYNANRKFYGIHQLLIVIFMFPWLKEAFNAELNGNKNLINNVNLISQNLIKQPDQSLELQLKKIKRFDEKSKSVNNSFKITSNTIIKVQESRNNGASYLNETELPSNEECLKWCLKTKQCNLAVYEEKDQGSCYLFDCGSPDDFKCKFTKHNFYTSSILDIKRENADNKYPFQQKHENDLVNLRTNVPINLNLSNANNKSQTTLTAKQILKDNKLPAQKCQQYQFACKNGTECVAIYNVCDGIPQCPDGSDEGAELNCPGGADSANQISQLSTNSKPINEAASNVNKDQNEKSPVNQLGAQIGSIGFHQTPNFNYKKGPEVIKLDKAPNTFQLNGQKNTFSNTNVVKPWPSILNLDQNGYPLSNNWNDYNAYFNALNNMNNQNLNNQNMNSQNALNQNTNQNVQANGVKDFNPMIWQQMNPNQQQKNFFDTLTNNIQQQQLLQSLLNNPQLNKPQFGNWLDKSNKNTAALQYINYLNSNKNLQDQKPDQTKLADQTKSQLNNPNPINLLNKNKTENIVISNIKSTVESSTVSSASDNVQASNLNRASYVSYDFKQPFIYNGKDDFYLDESEQVNNSAVIALVLGLFITVLLVVIVGFRIKSLKKRIQRRGRATLATDADYLINGMYL